MRLTECIAGTVVMLPSGLTGIVKGLAYDRVDIRYAQGTPPWQPSTGKGPSASEDARSVILQAKLLRKMQRED